MLVSAMYNIVDQIFIGQGVGMLGNAATNVAFPVTTVATALALLLGIGGASNYNLEMGAGQEKKASGIAGTALSSLAISGLILAVIVLMFLKPLLTLFGATADVMPYAVDYTGITAFGIPFLILTTGGTGPSRRDVTPEATLAVATRTLPGFGEQMRAVSLAFVPTAILSRQVGVLREIEDHAALIINLPGQPKAIAETLEGIPSKGIHGIFAAVPYCICLLYTSPSPRD